MAAPTIEADNDAASGTVSATVTAGNRLVIFVATETTESIDSVIRDGQSFTQIGATVIQDAGGQTIRVSAWERASPNTGTNNVVVTTSGGTSRIGVQYYSLVGAAAAQATYGSATGTSSTRTATFTVDTDDSLVLDFYGIGNVLITPTVDGSQTEYANFDSGGGSSADKCRCASSGKTSAAASVSMKWTTSGSLFRSALIAVAFPPSGGGPAFVASPPFIVQQAVTRAATF